MTFLAILGIVVFCAVALIVWAGVDSGTSGLPFWETLLTHLCIVVFLGAFIGLIIWFGWSLKYLAG